MKKIYFCLTFPWDILSGTNFLLQSRTQEMEMVSFAKKTLRTIIQRDLFLSWLYIILPVLLPKYLNARYDAMLISLS